MKSSNWYSQWDMYWLSSNIELASKTRFMKLLVALVMIFLLKPMSLAKIGSVPECSDLSFPADIDVAALRSLISYAMEDNPDWLSLSSFWRVEWSFIISARRAASVKCLMLFSLLFTEEPCEAAEEVTD